MELWLIRHPRPAVAADTCYGQLDLPLAAGSLAESLRDLPTLPPGARLRSSPARRCRDLAERLHTCPQYDQRLLERSFGSWEGQRWDTIDRGAIDAWADDPWDFLPPGGESTRQLFARVAGALDDELALGGQAVWVTHQGVARVVAGRLLGEADRQWMSLRLDFGGVWCFSRGRQGWQLRHPG
jgi:alpha-ribazole phosphatase